MLEITVTHLMAASSALENDPTLTIPSFTLPANVLGTIFVISTFGVAEPPIPTIPNWVAHTNVLETGARRMTLFTRTSSTPVTESLLVSFGGANQGWISAFVQHGGVHCRATGANGTDGIVQALGTTLIHALPINPTPTLATLAPFASANNASLSCINIGFNRDPMSPGVGFAQLAIQTPDAAVGTISQWKSTNERIHSLSGCTASQDMFIGIAVELRNMDDGKGGQNFGALTARPDLLASNGLRRADLLNPKAWF